MMSRLIHVFLLTSVISFVLSCDVLLSQRLLQHVKILYIPWTEWPRLSAMLLTDRNDDMHSMFQSDIFNSMHCSQCTVIQFHEKTNNNLGFDSLFNFFFFFFLTMQLIYGRIEKKMQRYPQTFQIHQHCPLLAVPFFCKLACDASFFVCAAWYRFKKKKAPVLTCTQQGLLYVRHNQSH